MGPEDDYTSREDIRTTNNSSSIVINNNENDNNEVKSLSFSGWSRGRIRRDKKSNFRLTRTMAQDKETIELDSLNNLDLKNSDSNVQVNVLNMLHQPISVGGSSRDEKNNDDNDNNNNENNDDDFGSKSGEGKRKTWQPMGSRESKRQSRERGRLQRVDESDIKQGNLYKKMKMKGWKIRFFRLSSENLVY